MRVEVVFETVQSSPPLEVPWKSLDPNAGYFDLREAPGAVEKIEAARRHPPLRAFLTAVNSADSLFATTGCKTWCEERAAQTDAGPWLFGSRVDLVFVLDQFNRERDPLESLANRLWELLTREPASDTLAAALHVCPCRFIALGGSGFCLRITLDAQGNTSQQAQLRWGLGLARIQQALLFSSRVLRQQISQVS